MKLALIAAAAISMMVTPALAGNEVENCIGMASLAKSVMELRQTGTDLSVALAELALSQSWRKNMTLQTLSWQQKCALQPQF